MTPISAWKFFLANGRNGHTPTHLTQNRPPVTNVGQLILNHPYLFQKVQFLPLDIGHEQKRPTPFQQLSAGKNVHAVMDAIPK